MPVNVGQVVYSSPVDFAIAQKPPDEIPPNLKGVFEELYNFNQRTIQAFTDYCGIGQQAPSLWSILEGNAISVLRSNLGRFYVRSAEAINFGAMINLTNVGAVRVRNANATNNSKPCHGFCSTTGGIAAGEIGEVILGTGVATLGGVTPGQSYYLSTANGLISGTPATAAGNIEQFLGFGIDSNSVYISAHYWIQH